MSLEQKYIDHVELCFEKAYKKESKLIPEIHEIWGMTGEMTRHFYNNLLDMPDARYLEIGTWRGSSSCSAMFGNKAEVVLMDNWAGFGGPKEECLVNVERFKGDNNVTFIEQDSFKFDISLFKTKFNIYLWDADHSESSTKMGITYYLPSMDDVFILVMDDWNMKEVRMGTQIGIKDSNLTVLWSKEIRLTDNDTHTPDKEAKETFHNGIAVFILKKQK